MDLAGAEEASGGDVGETKQGLHQSQLPRMIEFQTRDAPAVGQNGGLSELAELATIQKGFQDILLNIEVTVVDGGQFFSKLGQMVDGLF